MYKVKIAYVENGKSKNSNLECTDIDGIIHALKVLKYQKENLPITELYFFADTITEE